MTVWHVKNLYLIDLEPTIPQLYTVTVTPFCQGKNDYVLILIWSVAKIAVICSQGNYMTEI